MAARELVGGTRPGGDQGPRGHPLLAGGEPSHPIRDTQRGVAILGGEVLQIRITQKHEEGDLKLRFFAWTDGDGWQALLFSNAELNGVALSGGGGKDVLELEIPTGKPSAGAKFRWAWTLEGYEWGLSSSVDPAVARTFRGKRVPWRRERGR